MKSAVLSSLLVLGASAQYEWTCNHWSAYTVDVCYQYSTSYQYLFECNTTDSLVLSQFSDGSCGETDADPWYSITYWESSDTTDLFQCDQSAACDYAILRYYTDDECSGDTYSDGPFVTGQCYEGSSTSFEVSCGTDKLTVKSYTTAGDCTGSSVSATVNYASYNDDISGCYMVKFFILFFYFFCYFFFLFFFNPCVVCMRRNVFSVFGNIFAILNLFLNLFVTRNL